jgi:hypothetical protein
MLDFARDQPFWLSKFQSARLLNGNMAEKSQTTANVSNGLKPTIKREDSRDLDDYFVCAPSQLRAIFVPREKVLTVHRLDLVT